MNRKIWVRLSGATFATSAIHVPSGAARLRDEPTSQERLASSPSFRAFGESATNPLADIDGAAQRRLSFLVGLTAKALSCAARAHVATAERRAACPHVSRAMQAA